MQQTDVQSGGSSDLASYFASKLVGQPNAAERIIPFIQTYRAGLNHTNRPIGVFLLLGPTGTGKTRTVEVLADALHGNAQQYLRIDCGEFQLDHEVAKLIGAPPGYVGHRESVPVLSAQKLVACVTPGCNVSLVLFDEIEKAAPSLGQLLLGVLDKGRLTLGDSNVVNFENSLIFLTSNLGAREMMQEMAPSFGFEAATRAPGKWAELSGKLETIAVAAVKKRFSPEFVNRIDAVITYQPLSDESIRQILDHQIEELQEHVNSRLGSRCFSIELDHSARDFLLDRGVSVEYGARELKRAVYRHVTQPLATLVAENRVPPGSAVRIYAKPNEKALDFQMSDGTTSVREASRPAVMVVDDNESLLKFLEAALSHEGWDLQVAGSAQAAIQLAERTRFDLGLIDYMLPDMDGAALSKKLKAMLPNIEIVMMTGGGEMAFSKQGGFSEVPMVQKPFIVEDLIRLLMSRLSTQEESVSAISI
jgi:ATP-dependent Clp protease ATP-binding subunit ClpA/CheY-like chemotaxis protein